MLSESVDSMFPLGSVCSGGGELPFPGHLGLPGRGQDRGELFLVSDGLVHIVSLCEREIVAIFQGKWHRTVIKACSWSGNPHLHRNPGVTRTCLEDLGKLLTAVDLRPLTMTMSDGITSVRVIA